jgi:hypothetical protein
MIARGDRGKGSDGRKNIETKSICKKHTNVKGISKRKYFIYARSLEN